MSRSLAKRSEIFTGKRYEVHWFLYDDSLYEVAQESLQLRVVKEIGFVTIFKIVLD